MKLILTCLLFVITVDYSILAGVNNDSINTDSIFFSENIYLEDGVKLHLNDFNKGIATTPLQLIQGKVPGFTINSLNKNDPNSDLEVQLRGISTLYLSSKPLYIVDGIPIENPELVSVKNIQSIRVLKDLAETAIYGIRGCNGVVIIETKKAALEKFNITLESQGYFENFASESKYMSASEWRLLKDKWAMSNFDFLINRAEEMKDYNGNTDWREKISQNKFSQTHNVNFSGSNKKTTYLAFLSLDDYNGVIQKSANKRFQTQLSISQLALKDKLQLSFCYFGTYQKFSKINDNPYIKILGLDEVEANIITYADVYNPTVPVFASDTIPYYFQNPIDILNETTDKRLLQNNLILLSSKYEIFKGMEVQAYYSRNINDVQMNFSRYSPYPLNTQINTFSKKRESNYKTETVYSMGLVYNKTHGNHTIGASINYLDLNGSIEKSIVDSIFRDKSTPDFYVNYFNSNSNIIDLTASIKYYFKKKYYVSYSYTREKSHLYRFTGSKENFHGVTFSWLLKQESFLKGIDWIDEFTIDAGFGNSQRMFRSGDMPDDGNEYLAEAGFHGENLYETNLGMYGSVFSNRATLSISYYNRKIKDGVVFNSPFPLGTGLGKITNEAEIQNKGWEFSINANPLIYPFKWVVNFNFSFNNNIVLSNTFSQMYYENTLKGYPIGNFYGYKFLGYKDSEYASLDFEMMTQDYYGDTITDINWWSGRYKLLGNGVPKSYINLTNNFEYKHFDLSIFLRAALGFEIKNLGKIDVNGNNYKKNLMFMDQRHISRLNGRITTTDLFIEKGDYLKIDNISFGYTRPIENNKLESVRFYIMCDNVAIFSKFKDGDPEIAGINGINAGKYYYQYYPITRLYSIGIKIKI